MSPVIKEKKEIPDDEVQIIKVSNPYSNKIKNHPYEKSPKIKKFQAFDDSFDHQIGI